MAAAKPRRKKPIDKEQLQVLHKRKAEEAVLRFGRLWERVNTLTGEKGIASVNAIEAMRRAKMSTVFIEVDDGSSVTGTIRVTLVEGTRLTTDWDKVRRRVGADVWRKITKQVPDQALIDQALKEGLITTQVIAECSETLPNQPYLKPTIKGIVNTPS